MSQPIAVTQQDIEHGLRRLGVRPGCVLGVHSSLSSLGHVEGGAQAVLDALFRAVGPDGAILMSTYPLSLPFPLTADDLSRGITWKLRRLDPEDVHTRSGMGAIADAFRRRPDVVRGPDPVLTVSAWGRDADRFCQGFDRLIEADGLILLLGVHMGRCSALHVAETRATLPADLQALMDWPVPEALLAHYPPDEWLIGCRGAWSDFLVVQAEAEKQGLIRSGTIGAATARLFEARPVVALYETMLAENPYQFFS